MRIIVQVGSGPLQGHRYAVATGQQMLFGRTAQCDVAFPEDDRMSSRHFQIMVDHVDCRIRDLASTNGTWVNGERISLAVLNPGDRVQAGDTEFTLAAEGTAAVAPQPVAPANRSVVDSTTTRSSGLPVSPPTPPGAVRPAASAPLVPTPDPTGGGTGPTGGGTGPTSSGTGPASSGSGPIGGGIGPTGGGSILEGAFSLRCGKSTVNCYRGNARVSPPDALASRLARQLAPVLSLDLSKVDSRFQQISEPKQALHDWLPAEVQAESPHVLWTQKEQFGDFSVIADGWGKDAVVTIYCPMNEPLPLDQIRRCAGAYCRPSLVRPSLADTTADQVGDFMQGIDAVLVEDEDPESWVLYSQHDLRETLIGAGLTDNTPPETAG